MRMSYSFLRIFLLICKEDLEDLYKVSFVTEILGVACNICLEPPGEFMTSSVSTTSAIVYLRVAEKLELRFLTLFSNLSRVSISRWFILAIKEPKLLLGRSLPMLGLRVDFRLFNSCVKVG